jgi:stage V sporulation protein AD
MQKITYLDKPVFIEAFAAVGGYEESRGPLGDLFDLTDKSDLFGMKTWERAEGEMSRIALNLAMKKCGISPRQLDILTAGDLQNQCVASYDGLFSFGIPFVGLYGACSTATEGLIVLSAMLTASKTYTRGACITSSHNCAAERQFRTPLEYGAQRFTTAQWTATASGAFILSKTEGSAAITSYMPGRVIDSYIKDSTNMGGAMALAAFDTLNRFFDEESTDSFDLILTGDLGKTGSEILCDTLCSELGSRGRKIAALHKDAGMMLYDTSLQDVHSGASGCGCSASVLAASILPKVQSGEIKRVAVLSTGALMSPSSVFQGENILGVAPIAVIEHRTN